MTINISLCFPRNWQIDPHPVFNLNAYSEKLINTITQLNYSHILKSQLNNLDGMAKYNLQPLKEVDTLFLVLSSPLEAR